MENEYVIINKTKLLKRIEELEKLESSTNRIIYADKYYAKKAELKEILTQSSPLIPEIEKAFYAGCTYTVGSHKDMIQIHPDKQEYIDTLKLEI